jgi:hypothetical protein
MFGALSSSLGRWFGRRPSTGSAAEHEPEHRVWVRYPCDLETTVQTASNGQEGKRLASRVKDISRGGISLRVPEHHAVGALLSVELPGAGGGVASTVLAYVVRVTPQPEGGWVLGCTFAIELNDADLQPFGATRRKPAGPDKRMWVRFSCDVRASYRLVRDAESPPLPARVLDMSPSGVGLLTNRPVDVGRLLSLELRGAHGHSTLTMLASVVRLTTRPGEEWVLGCNFIRELTDAEMKALREDLPPAP